MTPRSRGKYEKSPVKTNRVLKQICAGSAEPESMSTGSSGEVEACSPPAGETEGSFVRRPRARPPISGRAQSWEHAGAPPRHRSPGGSVAGEFSPSSFPSGDSSSSYFCRSNTGEKKMGEEERVNASGERGSHFPLQIKFCFGLLASAKKWKTFLPFR